MKRRHEMTDKQRLRHEIVEGAQALHRLGAYSADEVEKTTMRMLGGAALPKLQPLSPK